MALRRYLSQTMTTSARNHADRGRPRAPPGGSSEPYVCVVALLVRAQPTRPPLPSSSSPSLPSSPHTTLQKQLEAIQAIRTKHDAAYVRWEPHLTLLPPFIVPFISVAAAATTTTTTTTKIAAGAEAEEEAEAGETESVKDNDGKAGNQEPHRTLLELSKRIAQVLEEFDSDAVTGKRERTDLELDQAGSFPLRYHHSVHLCPSPSATGRQTLRSIQSALEAALPETVTHARGSRKRKKKGTSDDYKPHLTIGQAQGRDELDALKALGRQVLSADGGCVRVPMDRIQLMCKPVSRSGPYDIFREFAIWPSSRK
ncbi:hypothetical protein FA10DRAFT_267030 [Acaromyces ingoldii]|uniref:Uncharacterized protein n=1 Tax=Acaromyces ingoldii TaxID=215250 RepID=A0A316YM02_9BASI|nr:hypothetical protein FA10DRAFT_267030 [Acaromyces ingoldii]PWN90580.1 hypothetical protein FA10DRAFT_267030 [Acaromyces ingoldii]